MTISPDARRTILVAAFEENALSDLFRNLRSEFGADDAAWLATVQDEARKGTLEAYRRGEPDRSTFSPVDLPTLSLNGLGTTYNDAVYLSRTETTIPAIHSVPPPPPGHSMWITGLWGQPPER